MRGFLVFALAVAGVWRSGEDLAEGVELMNGQYEDLVIAVDPTMMKPEDVSVFVDSVTALINEGSDALWKATHQKLSFGSVRLVLPNSWFIDTSGEEPVYPEIQPARKEFAWTSADIRLHEEVAQGGLGRETSDVPYTVQAGQCGVPGHYIVLHSTLLDPEYAEQRFGPIGKVLVHEWAHYRWGVFDERGYIHDDVYPSSYEQDGRFQSTGCFSGSLEGNWGAFDATCVTDENECYLKPDPASTPSSVRSSLMHLPYLSEGHFCDSTTHIPSLSTPQNRLCGNRSIWEVLDKHPDFKNAVAFDTKGPVTVEVHRSPVPSIFFLFSTIPPEFSDDTTVTDSIAKEIINICKIYEDTEIGMATFRGSDSGMEIIKEKPLGTIVGASEDDLKALLPDPSDHQSSDVPLAEALETYILPEVANDPRGTMVLTWLWGPPQSGLDQSLAAQLSSGKVNVFTLLRGFGMGDVPGLPEFLQRSGGSLKGSPKTESLQIKQDQVFKRTMEHLQGASVEDHFKIGESHMSISEYGSVETPKLVLEGLTIKSVFATMTFEPFDDSLITLQSLDFLGVPVDMKKNAVKLSKGYFLNIPLRDIQNTDFEISITISNKGNTPVKVHVIWTAEEAHPGTNDLDVQVWSSEDIATKADLEENKNFILYCKVTQDTGEAIRGISLTMVVTDGADNTAHVSMLDDGSGDPDLKQDDGIFSGILYGNWGPGDLTISQLYIGNSEDDNNINPIPAMSRSFHSKDADILLPPLMQVFSGHRHSGVQPINPLEGSCCGSFSESTKKVHGVNRYFENIHVVHLDRKIQSAPPRVMNLVLVNHMEEQNEMTSKMNVQVRFNYPTPPVEADFDGFLYRFDSDLTRLRDSFDDAKELTVVSGTYDPGNLMHTAQLTTSPVPESPVYLAVAPTSHSGTSSRGAPSPAVYIGDIVQITSTTSTTTTAATTSEAISTSIIPTTEDPSIDSEPTTIPDETTTKGGSSTICFATSLLILCHFLLALS